MNEFVKAELNKLNANFAKIAGESFNYFYCPILFRDEKSPLSQAHIINEAFPDSTRACTVQRADVDSFYGSRFEADFLDLGKFKGRSLLEILADRSLSRRFNAKLLHNGNPVDYLHSKGVLPQRFSRLHVGSTDSSLFLGLKMEPAAVIAAATDRWEIEVSRDLRLPMLVSTIKAAHLSLFKMLGYGYAFSSSGIFMGRSILGEFFLQNRRIPKKNIVGRALQFFRGFVHMVRPVISTTFDSQGTVTDHKMFMCMGGSGSAWAFIVLVKTGEHTHGVMIPTYQHPDQVDTFLSFLQNTNSSIQVASCHFEGDKWEISKETMPMNWPKDGILLS